MFELPTRGPARLSCRASLLLIGWLPVVFAVAASGHAGAAEVHETHRTHTHAAPPPTSVPPPSAETGAAAGHDAMHGTGHAASMDHGGMTMPMSGQFGPYSMSREASGTAWQPDSTPGQGVHLMAGEWSLMGHANLFGVYDRQGGPRGGSKTFIAGMLMGMAQRPVAENGTLGLRAMLSPDPFIGARG